MTKFEQEIKRFDKRLIELQNKIAETNLRLDKVTRAQQHYGVKE